MQNQVKLLIATHNPSKVKRYQNELAGSLDKIELISLGDLDFKIETPEEIGESTLEIVKNKVKFYFEKTGTPCFSSDSGLYFPNLPWELQPKQNVKGIAGAGDQMSVDEIYEKMIEFYSNLATEFGQNGELEGYFLDSFCVFDGEHYFCSEVKRSITLTDRINKKDVNFPICSLYKVKGKYYHDLTTTEMKEFLQESSKALKNIIQNWSNTL